MVDFISLILLSTFLVLIISAIMIAYDKYIFKKLNKNYKPENDLTRKESKRDRNESRGDEWIGEANSNNAGIEESPRRELLPSESIDSIGENSSRNGELKPTPRRVSKIFFSRRIKS